MIEGPDTPDSAAPRLWIHQVPRDMPSGLPDLPTGMRAPLPSTREGIKDRPRTGYSGPCLLIGRHPYFRLCALATRFLDLQHLDKTHLKAAMRGHIVAETDLITLYAKDDQ